ncbi:DoxX family protein [Pseudopedobacter saltans DSM 12145]|uniref:DoxX family protein n=1 Tax=Pseudopedobacter saltans (strain ATCC 51119 / DSM 12145 / JCM 21818 / CCUG 39354 / LMG 10337 / NBRC 100064 / NCIMB 13643) TaxID=762903 RepID=F0SE21_PSESL|nr:DoxX family membrane protein [Pseudopedobacter saltans]ADY52947.1 DoxX family protein [Pseudopedobacter saltans DSM 12145]
MKAVKFILCLLFGLTFINAGLDKHLHYMPVPPLDPELQKVGAAFMTIKWLMPLVGTIEILGGLLFIIPRTRALGAIVILPVLVGIILQNLTYMPAGLVVAGILWLIELWVLFDNREKYKTLLN